MRRQSFLTATGAGLAASSTLGALPARAQAVAASGNERNFVVDGSDVSTLSAEYLDMLARAGVDVWQWNGDETLLSLSQVYEFVDRHADRVALVRSFADIGRARNNNRLALIVGWQNAVALEEAAGNDWRNANPPQTTLRAYYQLGVRIINLAYNIANQFAGGCLDPTVPLSRAGEYLVRAMQEIGILVDCGGHLGERSSLDIVRIAKRPVVCTHSNVKALNDNPRCTSDRVIQGIASTGGVFGVNAVDAFMSWGYKDAGKDPVRDVPPQVTVSRYVDEIDYLMKLVGPDHIGLGPDFTHGLTDFAVDPKNSFQFPIEMTYKQYPVRYAKGFEDITQLGNVTAEMRRRGYNAENIDKILGGNWMRVYQAAWN
jgi:membrane dipeptidase